MTAKPSAGRRSAPRAATRAPAASIERRPMRGSSKGHPELGFGLWALGRWRSADERKTRAALDRAIAGGLRWFDTAEVYGAGRSERVLGEAMARDPAVLRETLVETKVSWEHLRPEQIRASLTGSLERMGLGSVDLYVIHAPDPHVPLAQSMPVLEALWKEGRIGAIGVSNFSLEEIEAAQRALKEAPIAVSQVRYNLFDRDDADPIREYCRENGIVLEAYTPLYRGLLTGRYLSGARVPATVQRFASRLFEPERLRTVLERARALASLADEAKVPLAALALHWLRERGAAPIFGASRPEQVDANLAAWAARPSRAVLDAAEAIARGDRA